MAATAHSRRAAAPALPRTAPVRPRPQPVRSRASAPRPLLRARLPVRLILFVACVSLLAAGRVTLSFAVVQKNLETEVVVREYRRLDGQNARLSDEVAGLSSSLRVRRIAVKRYGLVTPGAVEYVTARRAAGGATGAAR